MPSLIVADVDGTLVDGRGVPFDGVSALLELAGRPGYVMALASARPPWSLRGLAATLGPMVRHISAFQGAIVETADDGATDGWRRRHTIPIDPGVVAELDQTLDRRLARWWYTPDDWRISREDDYARAEAEVVGRRWSRIEARPPASDPILKILAVGPPPVVASAAPSHPGVQAAISQPQYLELVSMEIGPDKGIAALRANAGQIDRVIAVGDARNDIGMLRAADAAFTFADAPAEVQTLATVLAADRRQAFQELRDLCS